MLRRIRALTTADFFEARFSPATAVLYSFYGMLISVVFIAGALFSSGKMINALTGNALDEMAAQLDWQVPSISLERQLPEGADADNPDVREVLRPVQTYRQLEGYEYAILAMTVLFVTYGMAGGLGAAIITDFIQGVLTIAFSVLLLPFVFYQIGGFGALQQSAGLKPGMFDFVATAELAESLGREPITVFYVCILSITALAGIIVQPHIMGVCGAGKTEFEGRFGFTVGNFLKRLCTVAWTFTGLACIAWYLGTSSPLLHSGNPDDAALHAALTQRASIDFNSLSEEEKAELTPIDIKDKEFADQLFGRAAYDILPGIAPGLIGLLMASLLAAVMSTSDAQMVVSSGLFTENIYRRHLARDRSERHYVWVGRIAGLLIVASALVLQATFTDVIDAMKAIIKTPAAIGISMWFGIFWRRWNTMAVWVSTATAAITWTIVAWYPDRLAEVLPEFMFRETAAGIVMRDTWQSVSYLSLGVVTGVLTSLLTAPQSDEQLDDFFALLRAPVSPDEAAADPCVVPYNQPVREPVIEFAGFLFPRPSRTGVVGFVVAWILVFAIVGVSKWLSTVV
jgi:Na+/proline symporter